MNDSGCESKLLLHSVRVIRNHGFGPIGELHEIEQLLGAALGRHAVKPVHAADKLEILRTRQALEKAHALRNNADLALYFDRIRGKVHTEELHAAGSRCKQTRQNFDCSGFSSTI